MSDEDLPVVDKAFALEQTMGDEEFLVELFNDMLKDEESKIEEMEQGLIKDDHVVSLK